jgi:MerR family transcriptional regulator, thiopeptide resistance regulator
METAQEIRWGVGELARVSGLTVRTLHHWDAIGLLVPSERTGAGHRRYTGADVQRQLLADVRTAMDEGVDPADPRAQALGARSEALIEAFTGGDTEIRASLQRMYEQEGAEAASRGMVDPEVMAYGARIREAAGR